MLSTLEAVFDSVHARFRYTPDTETWNANEYWPNATELKGMCSPDGHWLGDCEDFALMCREELDRMGIANRLVVCFTENSECHCVCEVDGWILDVRQHYVMRRDDLQYLWVGRSGVRAGDPWHRIID